MEDNDHPIWPQRALPILIMLRGGAQSPGQLFGERSKGRGRSSGREQSALAWAENKHLVSWQPDRSCGG